MKDESIESNKFLCGDCPTRWNSTYETLKRVVDLRSIFFKYEEDDTNYERELSREPGARAPGHDDFGVAERMVNFLEKFKDTTESVSASTKPLAHLFFSELLDIDTHLRQWACDVGYCDMVSSMRTKFDKYWGKLDELNDYMYFTVLLDPTMKKDFMRHCFKSIVTNNMDQDVPLSKYEIDKKVSDMVDGVETRMEGLFKRYEGMIGKVGHNSGSQESQSKENVDKRLGKNSFVSKWRSVEENSSSASESELVRYLCEPKLNWSKSFDILKWWKQNKERFPSVARMVRGKLLTFSLYLNFKLL
ncbi:zinc finger BED domain-containing protein RICESLEEPER 1-like [Rutidosis leptorrhynchoides]|uniref:zinc finger BED domain-containing protein RICESLEEPER 1-like n=1 Tax=Rutidosis leptorrhynchoides TaxID=125765 RepID=UPI003A99694D